MGYVRKFLSIDVLTAARQRISEIYDIHDSLAVLVSGGKDSLACLHLARAEAEKRGMPVDAIFIDKEIFNPSIIRYMEKLRNQAWLRLHWICVPSRNSKFCMGQSEEILLWDPACPEKWLRPMPDWAVTAGPEDAGRTFGSRDMDDWLANKLGFKGKVGFILGLRTSESIIRYRSVVNKLHQPFLAASPCSERVSICKPIYDWQDEDVFKYLGENGIGWCPVYDLAHLAGGRLRTSTPLNAEAAKAFDSLRRMEPEFYQKLVDRWPEMMVHERYWKEFSPDKLLAKYLPDGLDGCQRYIDEQIDDPDKRTMAEKRLLEFRRLQAKNPSAYPPLLLLKHLFNGVYYRPINPLSKVGQGESQRATQRILSQS
jgi:predicted phosphoadenosine phosphosulfate sulfurtransferase